MPRVITTEKLVMNTERKKSRINRFCGVKLELDAWR